MKGKKVDNPSSEVMATLILKAIENDNFFNKAALLPKIKAVLNGFHANMGAANYNKIETPSDAARRMRTIEQKDMEIKFWLNKVKHLDPDSMKTYYNEQQDLLFNNGFIKEKKYIQ